MVFVIVKLHLHCVNTLPLSMACCLQAVVALRIYVL